MKAFLKDERFKHWPVISIAYHGLREGILNVSVKTWYKYQKLLDIKRPVPKTKRNKAKQWNKRYLNKKITKIPYLRGVRLTHKLLIFENVAIKNLRSSSRIP